MALVLAPAVWILFIVMEFFTFKWEWMMVAVLGAGMSLANLYGWVVAPPLCLFIYFRYLRCKYSSVNEMSNYFTKLAFLSVGSPLPVHDNFIQTSVFETSDYTYESTADRIYIRRAYKWCKSNNLFHINALQTKITHISSKDLIWIRYVLLLSYRPQTGLPARKSHKCTRLTTLNSSHIRSILNFL